MPIFTGPKKPGIFTGLGEGFGIFGPVKAEAKIKKAEAEGSQEKESARGCLRRKKVTGRALA